MKTYKVKTTFTFTGEFYVKAITKEEAIECITNEVGLSMGTIVPGMAEDTLDWEFDMIPEKHIKSVRLKSKKSNNRKS
jgi:hypothetical protein